MENVENKVIEYGDNLEGNNNDSIQKDNNALAEKITEGWSWAGSMLTTSTLIVSKKWGLLIGYFLLLLIPMVNVMTLIAFFIIGGIKGKKWIYDSDLFDSLEQKRGAIKSFEYLGLIMFILTTIAIIFLMLFGGILITMLMSKLMGMSM